MSVCTLATVLLGCFVGDGVNLDRLPVDVDLDVVCFVDAVASYGGAVGRCARSIRRGVVVEELPLLTCKRQNEAPRHTKVL